MEIWKKITDFNELYSVSNYGNVKNLEGEILSTSIRAGYVLVYLKHTKKNHFVHRLVAREFLKDFDSAKMVNHIDFNKSNNYYLNLEMVTNRENQCHLIKSKNKFIGACFNKNKKKWQSHIMINGKLKYIGMYNNQEEAYQARVNFEKENGIVNKYI
jgi:hypothetical protein